MLQGARAGVEKFWSLSKKVLGLLMVWGLIYSVVTIGRFGVAFDYDDTLVDSGAAFEKAVGGPARTVSWSTVNQSYDLEKPKVVANALAWAFRVLGFRLTVFADRPSIDGDALKKEWRRLVPKDRFVFTGEGGGEKARRLKEGRIVLFFGDGDTDIKVGREAGVKTFRIKRGPKSFFREDYRPGTMGELVLPLSEY